MGTDQGFPRQDVPDDLNLAGYWAVLISYRRLILLSVAVVLVVGILASLLTPPTYQATAVLNVEREKSSPFDINGSQQFGGYDPEFVPTQTRLMKSREVAERVVKRLKLDESQAILPSRSGFFSRKSAAVPSAEVRLEKVAQSIQGAISTTPIRGTNLVELSYVGGSPKLAADVVNAIAESYIDWNLEAKYLIFGQASRFMTAQIEQLRSEVAEREKQLQAYARREDIVSVDPQQNVTLQKLESLNKDYSGAVNDRVAKEARFYEMQTARPDTIADTLSNGFVSQLRNDQVKMEREYAEKLNVFKPDWPAMLQLKSQIDKGRQHLDSVIRETVSKARDVARSDYQTALRREASLKTVLQGQKNEAMILNSSAVEYNNLKTEVETKRMLLDTLLKRQAETEVAARLKGQRVSSIRVVDKALPPSFRFRPSHRRNGLLSLIFGLGIGIALAFILDYLDRSLRTTEAVEKYLRLPALGVIPAAKSAAGGYSYYGFRRKKRPAAVAGEVAPIEMIPQTHPRSTISEAYRAFRTAILLSRAGGLRTIVVTSSAPGEGKTSTSVNLAIVLAQLGKRVLLVDADLHKPRLHEIMRVSNRVGLVSVLAENVDPLMAMHNTSIKGLSFVPSGPTSPNPSGLLSSEAMKTFLEFAASQFDYVILDTPPVSPIADAILLGYQVDGVVLCVQGGKTPRDQVVRVRDKLIRSNVRILGVLINNLVEDELGYGKYYSYYATSNAYGEETRGRATAS